MVAQDGGRVWGVASGRQAWEADAARGAGQVWAGEEARGGASAWEAPEEPGR